MLFSLSKNFKVERSVQKLFYIWSQVCKEDIVNKIYEKTYLKISLLYLLLLVVLYTWKCGLLYDKDRSDYEKKRDSASAPFRYLILNSASCYTP